MKTALILDPSLRSADGHHFGAAQRLRTELQKLHFRTVCLVSSHIDEGLARDANFIPVFEKSIYGRETFTSTEFHEHASLFFNQLREALRRLRVIPNVVFLPSGDQVTVRGLAQYLKGNPHRDIHIVMWLLMAPHFRKSIDDSSARPLFQEYAEAFDALRAVLKDDTRLHVYCETTSMAAAYSRVTLVTIDVATSPNMLHRRRVARRRPPGASVNIACAGNVNVSKGYHLLPEAIKAASSQRKDLRFLIHGTVENTDFPEGRKLLNRIARLGPNVTVKTDILSATEYQSWLEDADLLLLPYDPAVYRTRGSGIFTEAVTLGLPVVVTIGCDFAREAIAAGRAIGIERYDAPSLTAAIVAAASRCDELAMRAEQYAASLDVDADLAARLSLITSAVEGSRPESPKGWRSRLVRSLREHFTWLSSRD